MGDEHNRSPQQKALDQRVAEPFHLPMLRFLFHVSLLGVGLVGGFAASNLFVERRYAEISSSIQSSFESNRAELLGEIDALHNATDFERQRADRAVADQKQQIEFEKKRHEREERAMRNQIKAAGQDLSASKKAAEGNAKKLKQLEDRKVKSEKLLKRKLTKAEEGLKEVNDRVEEGGVKLAEAEKALSDKSRKIEEYRTVEQQLTRSKQEASSLRDQLNVVRADSEAEATKQRSLDTEVKRRDQKHQKDLESKEEALNAIDGKRRDAEEKLAAMTRQYSELQQTLAEMSRQRAQ